MDIPALRAAMRRGAVLNTQHAVQEANADSLLLDEVWASLLDTSAAVIEDYPTDPHGPSCLILSYVRQQPVHSVVAFPSRRHAAILQMPGVAVMITVYRPDACPHEWAHDYRTRLPQP